VNKPYENFQTTAQPVTVANVDHVAGMRRVGGEFAPHNADAPILSGIDIAGVIGIAVMTLGPLAAYAFGA
jgi:hypothetical protein